MSGPAGAELSVPDAAGFREWLEEHGATATEVWVVKHHRASGVPSPTHDELVDQALCFGWIDSLQRRRDATSSLQRFSPRRPRSTWSDRNRAKVAALTEAGLMTPAGVAAFTAAAAPERQRP